MEKAVNTIPHKVDSDWMDSLKQRSLPFVGIFGFLVIWELLVILFKVPAYLLPKPTDIFLTIVDDMKSLTNHGWVTAYEMLLGYFLAIAVAIPLAIGITASDTFDRFIMPILLFFQVVPKIAIAPLFLIWFGFGTTPKVMVAFLISFFPIVIDTAIGLRSVSSEMIDLARSMGASKGQIFRNFRLPTSLPYLFSGLKVAATMAVVGAVVGEFVGADRGLGYLLLVSNSNLDTALTFAVIVALTLQGLVMYYAVEVLERFLIPWHISRRAGPEQATL
jgi:NitT/TauT family transport system permease protein